MPTLPRQGGITVELPATPHTRPVSQGPQESSVEGPVNWARGNQEQEEEQEQGVRPNPE